MDEFPMNQSKCEDIQRFLLDLLASKKPPLVVGLQGLQGCGKSFTCSAIKSSFAKKNISVIVLSIDDFYHDRKTMGEDTIRGHPGTHDAHLLSQTIDCLKANQTCTAPVYDKYALRGKGDRRGFVTIERNEQHPPQIILVEGWCIGFHPTEHPLISDELSCVDRHVKVYHELITQKLDAIVVLSALAERAFEWRRNAERIARQQNKTCMTDDEIFAFVNHYNPIYSVYLESTQSGKFFAEIPFHKVEL